MNLNYVGGVLLARGEAAEAIALHREALELRRALLAEQPSDLAWQRELGVTLLLVPVASMGPVYLATALVLGGVFVFRALTLWRSPSNDRAWRLFTYSITYLAALFAAVAVDALV